MNRHVDKLACLLLSQRNIEPAVILPDP
jgi:hypothetical protein